jgi:hypothetical protein
MEYKAEQCLEVPKLESHKKGFGYEIFSAELRERLYRYRLELEKLTILFSASAFLPRFFTLFL